MRDTAQHEAALVASTRKQLETNSMFDQVRQAQKQADPDAVLSIYDDPPTYWFHVVADLARNLDEFDELQERPLFQVLALADRKRKRENELAKSGNPMAMMMMGMM